MGAPDSSVISSTVYYSKLGRSIGIIREREREIDLGINDSRSIIEFDVVPSTHQPPYPDG